MHGDPRQDAAYQSLISDLRLEDGRVAATTQDAVATRHLSRQSGQVVVVVRRGPTATAVEVESGSIVDVPLELSIRLLAGLAPAGAAVTVTSESGTTERLPCTEGSWVHLAPLTGDEAARAVDVSVDARTRRVWDTGGHCADELDWSRDAIAELEAERAALKPNRSSIVARLRGALRAR